MEFAAKSALAVTCVLIFGGTAQPTGAQTGQSAHTSGIVVTPQEVRWAAAPLSLPKGAEIAVLYGDPAKEGPFAMRLRLPANYSIPAHTHPGHEIATVISGTFLLGQGAQADKEKTQALPAGSLFAYPPGMEHYAFVNEPTVVQISTMYGSLGHYLRQPGRRSPQRVTGWGLGSPGLADAASERLPGGGIPWQVLR
ncbi:cupin domain-containing protein [Paracraurococcus lichenis]|uniref:Cupin domain-containing protein n=1 Tax=Paracraurococcus lichenis TaxID=3064888 RepID=A0ABT9EBK5_9PROT|nr:cupin domain-containing protein [Paracraurococcus sp. LOR1-02]MDO9713348.1 cupin domain-containing protein [Paracraurococcus sp. LOR1-02]